jgi:hypothetical protein
LRCGLQHYDPSSAFGAIIMKQNSITAAALCALLSLSAGAQDDVEKAALEFTQPAEIAAVRLWRIPDERLAGLSSEQIQALLSARSTLIAFFRALENRGDVFELMTPEFARQYPDPPSVYQSVLGYETTLMQVAITGFARSEQDDGNVQLFFNATTFTEGEIHVSGARSGLRRVGSDWRVASVDADEESAGFVASPTR